MSDYDQWPTKGQMEAPFWRNGMTSEEYEKERNYFLANLDQYPLDGYMPLWKQKKLNS